MDRCHRALEVSQAGLRPPALDIGDMDEARAPHKGRYPVSGAAELTSASDEASQNGARYQARDRSCDPMDQPVRLCRFTPESSLSASHPKPNSS